MLIAAVQQLPVGRTSPGISVLAALLLFIAASVWLVLHPGSRQWRKKGFPGRFFPGQPRIFGAWTTGSDGDRAKRRHVYGISVTRVQFRVDCHTLDRQLHGGAVNWIRRGGQASGTTGVVMTNAVTVPDLMTVNVSGISRVGLCRTLLMIMFFLSFTMFAQFKAGATIMQHAWPGSGILALSEDF